MSLALESYRSAIDTDDMYVRSAARASLGDLLNRHRRHQEALTHLLVAADEAKAIDARQTLGVILDDIGTALDGRGELRQALEHHEAAVDAFREAHDVQGEGAALHNGARILIRLKRAPEAIERATRSLTIAQEVGDRVGEAACHATLAEAVDQSAGPPDLSLRHAETAVALSRETGSRTLLCVSLARAADVLGELGRDADAIDRLREAVDTLETLRLDAGAGDFRRDVHAQLRSIFPRFCSVLLRRARVATNGEALALYGEAFAISEAARSRGFLDLWRETRAGVRDGIAPALRNAERLILDELSGTVAERNRLILAARAAPDSAEPAAREQTLTARIGELEEQLRVAEARIRVEHPRYATLPDAQAQSIESVRDYLAASPGTAFLEYLLGPDASWLFVLTAEAFEVHALPAARDLESMCAELHHALASGARSYPHTRELHDALIGPALPTLSASRVERLLIAADGTLHVLPWALLKAEEDTLLLDRFVVQLTPSAAIVVAQAHEQLDSQDPGRATLLAFGDPRDLPAAGEGVLGEAFKRIPGTAHEVSQIARLLGHDVPASAPDDKHPPSVNFESDDGAVVVRTGEFATREAFLEALARNESWRYIHLATHAYADAARPGLSGIVFTGGVQSGPNPFLHAFELGDVSMQCDLCVLSACETGLGQLVIGEGMLGLARAFAFAGARSLCVSLWRIDDASTAFLMSRFYENLVASADPASALRRAQLETRDRYPEPFYWAAFAIVL